MTAQKVARWGGILAAFVPIPFAIYDVFMLRLWDAELWMQAVALGFMLAICLLAYGIVWGLIRLVARLFN